LANLAGSIGSYQKSSIATHSLSNKKKKVRMQLPDEEEKNQEVNPG
jgi:hypothetical protein